MAFRCSIVWDLVVTQSILHSVLRWLVNSLSVERVPHFARPSRDSDVQSNRENPREPLQIVTESELYSHDRSLGQPLDLGIDPTADLSDCLLIE